MKYHNIDPNVSRPAEIVTGHTDYLALLKSPESLHRITNSVTKPTVKSSAIFVKIRLSGSYKNIYQKIALATRSGEVPTKIRVIAL